MNRDPVIYAGMGYCSQVLWDPEWLLLWRVTAVLLSVPGCPWESLGVPWPSDTMPKVEGANFPPADHLSLKSHLFTIVLFLSN